MELYFGYLKRPVTQSSIDTLVTFSIPDIGVKFKAPYKAEGMAVEYASLLTLLEFVEVNPQLFSNRALEIFSNNFDLVNQVKSCRVNKKELVPYLQKALEYREKLKYSINWVPHPDNPAQRPEID